MIELKEISHQYTTKNHCIQVLQDINIQIKAGEFVCILGPSGCGKSTLLRIAAGIEQPSAGSVYMNEQLVRGPGKERGVVFQQPELFPWLSVEKNVAFGLRMRGIKGVERKQICESYLRLVGLSEFADSQPYSLSGGMKQRVAIARVLANDPSVILMDEPFAALDALTKQHMQQTVKNIWEHTNKAVLFITHDVEEALFLGTRILILSARPGRIIKEWKRDFRIDPKIDPKQIRYHPDFIAKRAELTDWIDQPDFL